MSNSKRFNTAFFASLAQPFVLTLGLMMIFTANAKASSTSGQQVTNAHSNTLASILQREIKQNDTTKAVVAPKAKAQRANASVAPHSNNTSVSHWRKNGQVVLGRH